MPSPSQRTGPSSSRDAIATTIDTKHGRNTTHGQQANGRVRVMCSPVGPRTRARSGLASGKTARTQIIQRPAPHRICLSVRRPGQLPLARPSLRPPCFFASASLLAVPDSI